MFKIQKGVFRQFVTTFCCCIANMTIGAIAGWSACAFPKIRNNEIGFRLTLFQEAWVVNFYYIGIMLSPFPAGFLMDALGRKTTLLSFSVFSIANWFLVASASNQYMLYLARLCAGLWSGSVTTIVPVFLTEVLEPRIRGSLGTIFIIMYFGGNLYEYIIGPNVTYFQFGILSVVLCVVFFASFLFVPETPHFYMMKGQMRKAEASLKWLRGDVDVTTEFESIHTYVTTFMKRKGKFKELFFNEDYRAAFLNVQAVYFIQKLSGLFTVLAYLSIIVPERVGPLTPEKCTLVTGVVFFVSVFFATPVIDRVGRKPLFIASNVGIVIGTIVTGTWYFLDAHSVVNLKNTTYIPFLGLLFYGVSFCLGVGPIASLYQGEVLPSNIKARATTMTSIVSAFASIINTTLFAVCSKYFGMYVNFFLFGLVSVFGLYFARYHFIETKGKSLQEIQEGLRKSHKSRSCDHSISSYEPSTKPPPVFVVSVQAVVEEK